MKAKISEIFKSIQGEGVYQSVEQAFVRFFGCTMRCAFCDTPLYYYREKSVQEVLDTIVSYGSIHSVALTGGEPLLHIEFLKKLTKALKGRRYTVYLETNGILYPQVQEIMAWIDIIAMDFKLPSSTGQEDFWQEHAAFLRCALQQEVFVKAVIGKETLLRDVMRAVSIIKEENPKVPLVLQPQHPFEEQLTQKLASLTQACQRHLSDVRVIAQLHKKLGVR